MTAKPDPNALPPAEDDSGMKNPERAPDLIQGTIRWLKNALMSLFQTIGSLLLSIGRMLRALVLVIPETITTLLPSVTTSDKYSEYNKELRRKLSELVDKIDLADEKKKLITDNWIDQISWTDSRAIRENDANTLIRWWQIMLGVLIPVITNLDEFSILGISQTAIMSSMGVFLAVVTAIAQFRRPDERWRHYRVTNEQYVMELWGFVALSQDLYEGMADHNAAFPKFDARMRKIRQDDVDKFFGNVVGDAQTQMLENLQKIQLQIAALQTPAAKPDDE